MTAVWQLAEGENVDDVGVIDLVDGPGFVDEALNLHWALGVGVAKDFDRHRRASAVVAGGVHGAHSTAAGYCFDDIRTDGETRSQVGAAGGNLRSAGACAPYMGRVAHRQSAVVLFGRRLRSSAELRRILDPIWLGQIVGIGRYLGVNHGLFARQYLQASTGSEDLREPWA